MNYQRGDIVLVNFDPALDGEAASTRPAIIVTNDTANTLSPAITVVPLTANLDRIYPTEYVLERERTGLNQDSKFQVQLIRSISRERIQRVIGSVPADLMLEVDLRLRELLALR